MKQAFRFALGATLFSPFLILEDVLRFANVPVSKHGLFRNDEGKTIMELWNESCPEQKQKQKSQTRYRTRYENDDSQGFNYIHKVIIPEGE